MNLYKTLNMNPMHALKALIVITLLHLYLPLLAQDDLMNLLDEPEQKTFVNSTFKGSRVILGHSVETKHKKSLEFLISHRFGRVNLGAYEFFGLDRSNIRLGLEYGLTEDITIGIGRSSYDKTIDSFLKWRFVRQSEGGFPFTMVLFNSLAIKTSPKQEKDPTIDFTDRLATTHQLLIARKISSNFSLQLMPTLIHKNRVEVFENDNQLALGIGGRIKLTKRLAFNAEYYYQVDVQESSPYHNSLSVGFDIETGGHVFQLHFTNSNMTVERAFITETSDGFFDGDIHFGFNISRTFQLGKKEKAGW